MVAVGTIIGVLGLMLIPVGIIATIRPVKRIWLKTRKRAVGLTGIGLALLITGSLMVASEEDTEQDRTASDENTRTGDGQTPAATSSPEVSDPSPAPTVTTATAAESMTPEPSGSPAEEAEVATPAPTPRPRPPEPSVTPTPARDNHLLSLRTAECIRGAHPDDPLGQPDDFYCEGVVRNVGGEKLEGVRIIQRLFDSRLNLIGQDGRGLDKDPLEPGQDSSFLSVYFSAPPELAVWCIEFATTTASFETDEEVPTRDDRLDSSTSPTRLCQPFEIGEPF